MSAPIFAGDPAYPELISDLGEEAPGCIFVRGPSWSPAPRAVGIVGSRRASEAGRRWAYDLGVALAESGVAVVSGGALGIDGAAHAGALAGRGRTLVVLPSPVDDPVPRSHRGLFEEVLEKGGTLMSELDVLTPGDRTPFMQRNRIIAALSVVVVVVEASARSGTRYTIEAALRLRRGLLGKAWPASDPRGAGLRERVQQRVETVDEVISFVLEGPAEAPPDVDDDPLWAALEQPRTSDELARILALEGDAMTTLLFHAEMEGRAERVGGRWRRGARRR